MQEAIKANSAREMKEFRIELSRNDFLSALQELEQLPLPKSVRPPVPRCADANTAITSSVGNIFLARA